MEKFTNQKLLGILQAAAFPCIISFAVVVLFVY